MNSTARRVVWSEWWERGDWTCLAPAIRALAVQYARPLCDGADSVDDIASIVVTRCWGLNEIPLDPPGFVVSMTVNAALDQFKSAYVRRRTGESEFAHLLDSRSSPLETLEEEEERAMIAAQAAHLLRRIGRMPVPYRSVIRLRYVKGLSSRETAKRLDLQEGTVKMRAVRGRRWLLER